MDFRVTVEQKELASAVRDFCAKRGPRLGKREEAEGGLERALFRDLAELGVFSLRLSEDKGGLGRPMADAVLVFEELGRALVPGPLVWTHLAAGLVEGAAEGQCIVGGFDVAQGAPKPAVIPHLGDLDVLLIVREDGVDRIDATELEHRRVEVPLDPLTPVGLLASVPQGVRIGGRDDALRLRRQGTALVAGQLLGIAEATLALAVDYAKVRQQFGRPIGGFQAIKHILADMFVRCEVARAAAYAAGATLDAPEVGDAGRAVAVAKLEAGDAAIQNAKACIQVHGGMGYTWEVAAHYYLKRAWVLESMFGTREERADEIGAATRGDDLSA